MQVHDKERQHAQLAKRYMKAVWRDGKEISKSRDNGLSKSRVVRTLLNNKGCLGWCGELRRPLWAFISSLNVGAVRKNLSNLFSSRALTKLLSELNPGSIWAHIRRSQGQTFLRVEYLIFQDTPTHNCQYKYKWSNRTGQHEA